VKKRIQKVYDRIKQNNNYISKYINLLIKR